MINLPLEEQKYMKTSIKYKNIWTIAYPIIVGSIAQNIITLTDTAFLGHVSEIALGAVALAGLLYIVFTMLMWGFSTGLQIVVARNYGKKNNKMIGANFDNALVFSLLLSLFLFVIMKINAHSLLNLLLKSDNIYQASADYLNIRSWGIFISGINYLYRGFYIGITKTKVIGQTTFIMAIVNILIDYLLIFGKFGLPELGVEGAAIASVCAEIVALIYFTIYTIHKENNKRYHFFKKNSLNLNLLYRLVKISIPTMVQSFLSLACWFLFFIFVENLGERPIASANIVRSLYMLINVPIWAFGAAASTLTSQLIGARRQSEVFPMLRKVAIISTVCVVSSTLMVLLFPSTFLSIYTDNKELISYSINSLFVVGSSSIFFGFSITFFQAVSGTGKTQHAMYIEIAVLLFYTLYAWFLSSQLKLDVAYVWTSEPIYAFLLGISSYLYMRRYRLITND